MAKKNPLIAIVIIVALVLIANQYGMLGDVFAAVRTEEGAFAPITPAQTRQILTYWDRDDITCDTADLSYGTRFETVEYKFAGMMDMYERFPINIFVISGTSELYRVSSLPSAGHGIPREFTVNAADNINKYCEPVLQELWNWKCIPNHQVSGLHPGTLGEARCKVPLTVGFSNGNSIRFAVGEVTTKTTEYVAPTPEEEPIPEEQRQEIPVDPVALEETQRDKGDTIGSVSTGANWLVIVGIMLAGAGALIWYIR